MQYFKKYSKNSGSSGEAFNKENRVINLNRTLQICLERAMVLYSCRLTLDAAIKPMFTKIPAEEIIKHIFFLLEQHCDSFDSLTVKLEQQGISDIAIISIMSGNTCLNTIEIELYTGLPGVVVKEIYENGEIEALTCKITDSILKMRKG